MRLLRILLRITEAEIISVKNIILNIEAEITIVKNIILNIDAEIAIF